MLDLCSLCAFVRIFRVVQFLLLHNPVSSVIFDLSFPQSEMQVLQTMMLKHPFYHDIDISDVHVVVDEVYFFYLVVIFDSLEQIDQLF